MLYFEVDLCLKQVKHYLQLCHFPINPIVAKNIGESSSDVLES